MNDNTLRRGQHQKEGPHLGTMGPPSGNAPLRGYYPTCNPAFKPLLSALQQPLYVLYKVKSYRAYLAQENSQGARKAANN
jgi:hypothetical protein